MGNSQTEVKGKEKRNRLQKAVTLRRQRAPLLQNRNKPAKIWDIHCRAPWNDLNEITWGFFFHFFFNHQSGEAQSAHSCVLSAF